MDMLIKLEWEWDKMRAFDIRVRSPEKSYFALNAATTAWHLCDWVASSLTSQQFQRLSVEAGTAITNVKTLQTWAICECNAMMICDQIANGAKHFGIKKRQTPITAKEREFLLGEITAYYLMIEGGGNLISMDWIIGLAYRFWKEVFLCCGLAEIAELEYPMVPRAWSVK
jgi:hypothetical protein